jgi:formamidopyrimidine-DNA glycosylase
MPEFVEVEAYRCTVEPLVGERVDTIDVIDDRILRRAEPAFVYGVVGGATIERTRRIGKVLFLDLSGGHTASLAFGLRGWLSLDGRVALASGGWRDRQPKPEHVRLRLDVGGRIVELEDQLRLATLEVDIDESQLGTDVMALTKAQLTGMLRRTRRAVKTALMDQHCIAGIGNLIADEILYQAGIDPRRAASDLDADELSAVWTGLRRTRKRVLERNGSHQGVLIQRGARERGGRCPRCGVEIQRVQVGGRTTYYCPEHQH